VNVVTAEQIRRLAAWLTPFLGSESGGPLDTLELTEFERAPAGQSSDTVLFRASWVTHGTRRSRRLVLRRERTEGLFMRPDVVREGMVIQALEADSDVPVPHVVGCEADPAVLGVRFFVMDHVQGRVPVAKPSIHATGWLTTLSAKERRKLWDSAMEVLVAVHSVNWRRTHRFLADGEGLDPAAAHLDRVITWYRWTTRGRPFPITDAAVDELLARRDELTAGAPVLVWGDARPGNLVFDESQRCVAALDWELATVGPPEIDLAHWLIFDDFATSAAGVERLPGWPDRDTTVARYEALSGRRMSDLGVFELLEELVVATTLIRQADIRVQQGLLPPDTRMGHANTVTQMIARRLGLPIPELSPDYVAYRSPATSSGSDLGEAWVAPRLVVEE
jgi:aminoglycoside phosphotransferase (APT) family kinase protein